MLTRISTPSGLIAGALLSLALVVPAQAQPPGGSGWGQPPSGYGGQGYPPPPPSNYGGQGVPNISGVWYNNSNGGRCQVIQQGPSGQALFINEQGNQAWGSIRGDTVFIPAWNNGQGQQGWIRGNRIVWPDGNFWAR
jgi:hypothetical protein